MPSNGRRIDPIERGNELIGTRRELEPRDLGVVVTHRITGRSRSPVQFQLFDPLPGAFEIDDIGFHPEFAPEYGRIDHETAVISGVVKPEQVLEIKYGIRPTHPEPPEEIGRIQSSRQPSIEISAIVGPTEDVSEALEQAATTRSTSKEQAAGESRALSDRSHRLWSDGEETASSEVPEAGASAEADLEPGEDDERSNADEHWIETLFGEDDDEDRTASDEGDLTDPSDEGGLGSDFWGIGGDPFGDSPANGALSSEITRAMARSADMPWDHWASEEAERVDEEYRTFETIFGGIEGESAETSAAAETTDMGEEPPEKRKEVAAGQVDQSAEPETFGETLLRELESGAVSDDQGRRLATQIAECGVSAPSAPTEQRLRTIAFEMEPLEKHADVMETIIDEHGTADRYLGEVRGEISELEGSIRALEADLEAAADDREWTAEHLDELEKLSDDLANHTKRLEARIDSFRTAQRSTFAESEAQLADLGPVVERVDQIDAELGRLQGAIESGRRVQRSILRALSDEGTGGE